MVCTVSDRMLPQALIFPLVYIPGVYGVLVTNLGTDMACLLNVILQLHNFHNVAEHLFHLRLRYATDGSSSTRLAPPIDLSID